MFDPYDIKASILENGVNVTKLNYKYNLQEITHDFMVVDVFTDTSGYNNTIQTCSTTSTYCCSNLNGYYKNDIFYNDLINHCVEYCFSNNLTTCTSQSNYTICPSLVSIFFCGTGDMCTIYCSFSQYLTTCNCYNQLCDLSKLKYFCFNVCGIYNTSYNQCVHNDTTHLFCITLENFSDCKQYTYTSSTACNIFQGNFLAGYCFVSLGANVFCLYCNGTGLCCITLTANPELNAMVSSANPSPYVGVCAGITISQTTCMCILGYCSLYLGDTKIATVSICFSCPIKSVYYTDESYGAGSRVYNVIDASTGNCIACNLLPNTTYSLCDNVCCHRYEIIQCNDGISCIKSYAILAGHA